MRLEGAARVLQSPTRTEPASELEALDVAVLKTVAYAALFECPLPLERLHRMLWEVEAPLATIEERLSSPDVRPYVTLTDGCVHPRGSEHWVAQRAFRKARSRALVARHRRALGILAALPFVRLVALTGGCAHDNATDDDLDVFLVARRGRAWGLMLMVVLMSRILGCRRTLCVNYVVDEAGSALPERDVFTAAELAGLSPWAGAAGYRALLEANAWVAAQLPNFAGAAEEAPAACRPLRCPRWVERLLELGPAALFEGTARWLLGLHFRRKWRGVPGVTLTPTRLKLHPIDHGPLVRQRFLLALRAWRLS